MSGTPSLPTPRLEAWRFSNLPRVLDGLAYTPLCTTPGCLEAALPVVVGPQLVFHNGVLVEAFSHSISLAPGVTVETLPAPPYDAPRDALDSLVPPALTVVRIPHTLALPLHLIYVMSGPPSVARVALDVAPGAHVTLVEHHVAAPSFSSWQHVGVELKLGHGARVDQTILQTLPPACVLTRRMTLLQAENSVFSASVLQAGGLFARMETHATLDHHARHTFTGIALPRHTQHFDTTLALTLTGEHNTVDISQKNAVGDAGTAVFQGLLHVLPEAQKTDAQMQVKSLLLDAESRAFHKPELSILADDVRCTHGAALGGVDPAQMFYLQARGLAPATARHMLVEGFIKTVTEAFPPCVLPLVTQRMDRFLTEAAFSPTQDPEFEPLAEGFMATRSDTPFERQTDDTMEVTDA